MGKVQVLAWGGQNTAGSGSPSDYVQPTAALSVACVTDPTTPRCRGAAGCAVQPTLSCMQLSGMLGAVVWGWAAGQGWPTWLPGSPCGADLLCPHTSAAVVGISTASILASPTAQATPARPRHPHRWGDWMSWAESPWISAWDPCRKAVLGWVDGIGAGGWMGLGQGVVPRSRTGSWGQSQDRGTVTR